MGSQGVTTTGATRVPAGLLAAAGLLQAGAVMVAVAMLRRPELDYDAFAIPKELAFSASVWAAAACCLPGLRGRPHGRELAPLLVIVALGAVSVLTVSVNPWWGVRGLAASVTTVAAFLCARKLAQHGLEQHVLNAGVILVGTVALGIALEATALLPPLSIRGRGPAGFAGNRNFAAHALALGLPLLIQQVLAARTALRRVCLASLLSLAVAALCATRCRAAWLAAIALVTLSLAAAGVPSLRRLVNARAAGTALLAIVLGLILGAAPTPTSSWSVDGTFSSTLPRIVEYERGTGRGRLIQYRNTLRLIAANPLLGVAPGNWSLRYPALASPGDPSVDTRSIQPVPRLPNSDWLGFAAERGLPALVLLLVVLWYVARGGVGALLRAAREGNAASGVRAVALLGTLTVLIILGSFDAVLQRSEPALLAALVIGAWGAPGPPAAEPRAAPAIVWQRAGWSLGAAVVVSFLALRLAASFWLFAPALDARRRALELDRGNFVATTSLAIEVARRRDCGQAIELAERARRLNPFSPALRMIRRYCPVQKEAL